MEPEEGAGDTTPDDTALETARTTTKHVVYNAQLRYVQTCDELLDQESNDADGSGNHYKCSNIVVRISWLTENPSWHALEVIKLQSPYVIIEYVTRQKLFRHEDFVWVNEYTSENGKLT